MTRCWDAFALPFFAIVDFALAAPAAAAIVASGTALGVALILALA